MAHLLLYFIALVALSTSPNWAKLNEMPAELLGFWRLALACLGLILFVALVKKEKLFRWNKHSVWVLTSGLFLFFHLWTYKYAAKHTLVSNTMILFMSNPIWASIGGAVFFKERITSRLVLSYFVALLGIFILVKDQFHFAPENTAGNMVALLSAFFFAGYMLSGKKARGHFSNSSYTLQIYGIGALCFLATVLITNPTSMTASYSARSWVAVAGLVLLPTFSGHVIMSYLVKTMNIGVLTCGKLIEPLFGSLFAYWIFRENLGQGAPLAFALIALAVISLFWPQMKNYSKKIRSTK